MSEVQIFTAILVPSTTNGPSMATLQWSEDGQAFTVTRGAIHILTPSTGINFEPSSVITSSLAQSANNDIKVQPLSFYRTMIELEKTLAHNWPVESQEWSTVSLGSLDMSWCSITLSPSNLSQQSSCVLVALNTNLEVSLWTPGKNYLTGEWSKIQDVTQVLKETEPVISSVLSRTLNAQVHAISWSQQVYFGEGTNHVDGSLLALGNRAGHVVFMQLSSAKDGLRLRHVATVGVSDDWVHHLAWSAWRKVTLDRFQASLACGVPDGGIIIISVTLFIEHPPHASAVTLRFHFELQDEGKSCCPSDNNAITALIWIESNRHASILAYTKPGMVYLQTFPSELPLGWSDRRVLTLKLQPLSSSSTPYAAASGLVYYEQHNALVVCLYDGSFHVIHGVSTSPSIYALDQTLSSEELTRQVRGVFATSEGAVNFSDANRTSGICNYDGAGTIMWLHEKCNPDDLSYKHDAKHASMFIVTRLWRDDALLFERLESQITGRFNFDIPPTHTLRGAFLYLRDSKFLESHQDHVFELLVRLHTTGEKALVTSEQGLFESEGSDNQLLRQSFRHRLATDLFRRRHMVLLRLGFVLATFCSSVRPSSSFEILAQDFLKSILCSHLQTLIRQVDNVVNLLEDIDRNFVHRWITQTVAQGPPLLQQEAMALAHKVGVPADSPLESLDFGEQCPACHVIIPLGNSSTAACPNGHIWARCSITSFVLATPCVRTCIGCCRKALLPASLTTPLTNADFTWLPPIASSWLVQGLLEAASWCIYCGNRFVRVL